MICFGFLNQQVKQYRKKYIALFLLIVYNLAVGFSYDNTNKQDYKQDIGSVHFSSDQGEGLLSHTLQTGKLDFNFSVGHLTSSKISAKFFAEILISIDRAISGSFVHYNFLSEKNFFRFPNTRIIFPFHYFW